MLILVLLPFLAEVSQLISFGWFCFGLPRLLLEPVNLQVHLLLLLHNLVNQLLSHCHWVMRTGTWHLFRFLQRCHRHLCLYLLLLLLRYQYCHNQRQLHSRQKSRRTITYSGTANMDYYLTTNKNITLDSSIFPFIFSTKCIIITKLKHTSWINPRSTNK